MIAKLCNMMAVWANNEEQENDCYPKSGDEHNANKRNNDYRNKGQWEYSDSDKKCKLDDHVATLEHPSHGRKT